MSFYCRHGLEPGESPTHKHETVAEMRSMHALDGGKESDPAASHPSPGTHLPASPSSPAAGDSVAPSRTSEEVRVLVEQQRRWVNERAWHETKKEDAVKHLMMNRTLLVNPKTDGLDWEVWSDKWDAVYAVDANGRIVEDPRLKLLKGMIPMIPDGYFATQADDTATVDFLMLSRPNRGQYKDHIKVSTQHSENWMPRLALMPNGRWLVLDRSKIDPLMLVVADYRTCALRYAVELQHCWVCNTALTDDRSRHYLIGPICDKKPQGVSWLEKVDNEFNGGLTYDDLVRLGQPTRVWQESVSL